MADTIKFLKTIIDTNDSPYTTEYEVLSTLKEICPNEVYVFSQGTKTITASALSDTQRSTLKYIGIPSSVTTIEEGAFQNCTNLLSIRIPDSVTSLGASAFSGCSKLTNAVLGRGITTLNKDTFSNCTYLKSISMPKVTRAYSETFNNCTALQGSVYNNAVYVGSESNPYLVLLRPNVEPISLSNLTIHERTQIINNSALRECTRITGLQIPESVLEIGCNALSASGELLSLRIPFVGKSRSTSALTAYEKSFGYIFGVDNTTTTSNYISVTNLVITSEMSINTKAFNGCKKLTNFTLGNVEDMSTIARSIGNQAFLNCTSLKQVILPNSVTTIGANAFSGCTNLQTVSIFASIYNQQYKSQLHLISNAAFDSCTSLNNLNFPAALNTINAWAFTNCTSLTYIAASGDIPTIGRGAFNGTPYLTNSAYWNFPDCQTVCSTIIAVDTSVSGTYKAVSDSFQRVYIGAWAFRNCSSITEIILPGCCTVTQSTHDACGVTCDHCGEYDSHCYNIGDYAFEGCSSLRRVCIPSTVTSIGTEAFSACPNIQEIEFYGTETEWDNITKANNWNGGITINVYPTMST